jgi:DNA repair exonuclease SbcCD nuclease subunit
MALFNKVASFSDIHFGEDGDSKYHNELCISYIKWFIDQCKENDVDLIIFMGDWHHARSKVGSETLKYSYKGTKLLNECGIPVLFLIGNHDLFYRENRSVHSLPWLYEMDNITVIDDPTVMDDVLLVPWLVESDDLKQIANVKVKYAFGHFELPGFLMNEKYAFPDKEGILKSEDMDHLEYVFSGHFHARQKRTMKSGCEIHYIGNPFPHDFNDVNDRERGMMILEYDNKPQYINWPDAPYYEKLTLSQLLEQPEKFDNNSHIKVIQDVEMTSTEKDELRQTLLENFGIVHVSIEPDRTKDKDGNQIVSEDDEVSDIENVELYVVNWITENEATRKDRMIELFTKAQAI